MSMIEAEGMAKRFGSTQALADVDLVAEEGKVLALLGPNGAGKTTLVRILATLLKPDSGRATVAGCDVVGDAGRLRPLIGLTGQFAAVERAADRTREPRARGTLLSPQQVRAPPPRRGCARALLADRRCR